MILEKNNNLKANVNNIFLNRKYLDVISEWYKNNKSKSEKVKNAQRIKKSKKSKINL